MKPAIVVVLIASLLISACAPAPVYRLYASESAKTIWQDGREVFTAERNGMIVSLMYARHQGEEVLFDVEIQNKRNQPIHINPGEFYMNGSAANQINTTEKTFGSVGALDPEKEMLRLEVDRERREANRKTGTAIAIATVVLLIVAIAIMASNDDDDSDDDDDSNSGSSSNDGTVNRNGSRGSGSATGRRSGGRRSVQNSFNDGGRSNNGTPGLGRTAFYIGMDILLTPNDPEYLDYQDAARMPEVSKLDNEQFYRQLDPVMASWELDTIRRTDLPAGHFVRGQVRYPMDPDLRSMNLVFVIEGETFVFPFNQEEFSSRRN